MDHPALYIDVRCLQDPDYRVRGIGQHLAALLRTRLHSSFRTVETVALTDCAAPALPGEIAALFDSISVSPVPPHRGSPPMFIDGSPMTHDGEFSLSFAGNPRFVSAAVIYDFIPFDWPGYLPTIAHRMRYVAQLARLRQFTYFLPLSEYSAYRLTQLLGVDRGRIRVTGASVRHRLYELLSASRVKPRDAEGPYFLTVAGPDARKNPEVAVAAVRRLNLLYGGRFGLKVAGHDDGRMKRRLLAIAGHGEGEGFLEFCFDVPDEELVALYAHALATVVPSHIEGFSLPVVEATLCGCPAVASTCAAHLELIEQDEALFPSHDSGALADRLEALLTKPALRASLAAAQRHLGAKFHENEVGRRFWDGLEELARPYKSRVIASGTKLEIALGSDLSPGKSGCPEYVRRLASTCRKMFRSVVYTATPEATIWEENLSFDVRALGPAALLDSRHDAFVSFLGKSSNAAELAFFERYGGPCVLHDLRLVDPYRRKLSHAELLELASSVLGRPASDTDFGISPHAQENALLLVEPILRRASPLIVQTPRQKEILKARYGVDAHALFCCPSSVLSDRERTSEFRRSARERLGISHDVFAIVAFCAGQASEVAVMSVDLLRAWGIPAALFFARSENDRSRLLSIAEKFEVTGFVHFLEMEADSPFGKDALAAADSTLHLRAYEFGSPCTDLCDAIGSGIPVVATADMTAACDASSYAFAVPDYFSPLHVAERLSDVFEAKLDRQSSEPERLSYIESHSLHRHALRLLQILGLR